MTSPSDVERTEGVCGVCGSEIRVEDGTVMESGKLDIEGTRLRMLHELLAALGRDFAQPITPAAAWSDALVRVQTLTEERDEAIIRERTFYNNWQEARANEAAQIAKGLQLAAQLDYARALLRETFEHAKPRIPYALQEQVVVFLQPSNEEGPRPLRPNPTVKSI